MEVHFNAATEKKLKDPAAQSDIERRPNWLPPPDQSRRESIDAAGRRNPRLLAAILMGRQ
ncbi:MAG TPA: hypothetical protein VLY24_09915 [Bryobacteraceae bacterium]|nr:hypothetical protein [Bryobacteraceae bacterium]